MIALIWVHCISGCCRCSLLKRLCSHFLKHLCRLLLMSSVKPDFILFDHLILLRLWDWLDYRRHIIVTVARWKNPLAGTRLYLTLLWACLGLCSGLFAPIVILSLVLCKETWYFLLRCSLNCFSLTEHDLWMTFWWKKTLLKFFRCVRLVESDVRVRTKSSWLLWFAFLGLCLRQPLFVS